MVVCTCVEGGCRVHTKAWRLPFSAFSLFVALSGRGHQEGFTDASVCGSRWTLGADSGSLGGHSYLLKAVKQSISHWPKHVAVLVEGKRETRKTEARVHQAFTAHALNFYVLCNRMVDEVVWATLLLPPSIHPLMNGW